jgi:hypothetical protein
MKRIKNVKSVKSVMCCFSIQEKQYIKQKKHKGCIFCQKRFVTNAKGRVSNGFKHSQRHSINPRYLADV